MLVDSAVIFVRSGKGGDGCVSFRREKYIPKGGPDGGDGGDGGSVIFRASPNVDTLLDFAGRHHWRAGDGHDGRGKQQFGKNGEDLIIEVPPGTQVFDEEAGEMIGDLDSLGEEFVVAEGGKGGLGNEHFKSATNQVPRESTPGEPAVERTIRLELKLIADIGLVGKPNAGKSTFLSAVSAARPRVADYPFTTLTPNLGIAELAGHRRLVIADIPGLIEGAAEGHGLGTDFLRHIERTRLLLHLLEIEPTDGSDPVGNYRAIRGELERYAHGLTDKPEIVVLSKMDLLGSADDQLAAAELIERELELPVVPVSSSAGLGLTDLLELCWRKLEKDAEPQTQWSR